MSADIWPVRRVTTSGYACWSRLCRGPLDHHPSCSPWAFVTLWRAADAERFATGMRIGWPRGPVSWWRRAMWWRSERCEVIASDAEVGTVTQVRLRWSWLRWEWVRA